MLKFRKALFQLRSIACALLFTILLHNCMPKENVQNRVSNTKTDTKAVTSPVAPTDTNQAPLPDRSLAGSCLNPLRQTTASENAVKCCIEKKYGTATTACQSTMSKCWSQKVWDYLNGLTTNCGGNSAVTMASNSPKIADKPSNSIQITLANGTCEQLYVNPSIGTPKEYCTKCAKEGGKHADYCNSQELNGSNSSGSSNTESNDTCEVLQKTARGKGEILNYCKKCVKSDASSERYCRAMGIIENPGGIIDFAPATGNSAGNPTQKRGCYPIPGAKQPAAGGQTKQCSERTSDALTCEKTSLGGDEFCFWVD